MTTSTPGMTTSVPTRGQAAWTHAIPGPLTIGNLVLDPPMVNASGAFDVQAVDTDWSAPASAARVLGAYVTKTVTRHARAGNPQPWVEQLAPDTLVNSVGLANPGVEAMERVGAALVSELGDVPVIMSIGGSPDELAEVVALAEHYDWVAAYELNLSCPNVAEHGGLAAGDPERTRIAVAVVREISSRPIIAKLSAACSDVGAVARAAERAGADAISAINTMPVRAVDDDGRALLGSLDGGMSGALLHPIALRAVANVVQAVDVPVIGIGGVSSPSGARRMFDAGAVGIGIGTSAAIAPTVLATIAELWGSASD